MQHSTPTPLNEYPVKPLKSVLDNDYNQYAANMFEQADIVDHRIVTRLMPPVRPSPQVWLILRLGMCGTNTVKHSRSKLLRIPRRLYAKGWEQEQFPFAHGDS